MRSSGRRTLPRADQSQTPVSLLATPWAPRLDARPLLPIVYGDVTPRAVALHSVQTFVRDQLKTSARVVVHAVPGTPDFGPQVPTPPAPTSAAGTGTESVNADEYPIYRPLYMYTAPAVVNEKPQVAYLIAYYLNNVNDVIGDVGYFPAPDERLMAAGENIVSAAGWDVQ